MLGVAGETGRDGGGGVAFGVVEEVAEYAGQECVVAVYGDRFGVDVSGQGEVGRKPPAACLGADEVGQVEWRARRRVGVSGVEPGEEQQVGGEGLQAQGVVVGGADDTGPVSGVWPVEGEFEFGSQAGERRPQFVGGVGGELALPVDGVLEAVEGGVHGVGEPGDLASGAWHGDALVEMASAELREVGADGLHRAQHPSAHQPGAACDEERHPDGARAQLPYDSVETGLLRAQRVDVKDPEMVGYRAAPSWHDLSHAAEGNRISGRVIPRLQRQFSIADEVAVAVIRSAGRA